MPVSYTHLDVYQRQTAACAGLNADGQSEVIIDADITGGGRLPDGTRTQNGGFIYVFDKDGNVLVRRFVAEAVFSSPAVADLDCAGLPEIVTLSLIHP